MRGRARRRSAMRAAGSMAGCTFRACSWRRCFYNRDFHHKYLGGTTKNALLSRAAVFYLEHLRGPAEDALRASRRFTPPVPIADTAEGAEPFLSIGNQYGEGWFLCGEMVELLKMGVPNVVCIQPFGCLPNHVMGKGVVKTLKNTFPEANIAAVDYDPGASEVNQLNRIKLMLSTARDNLEKREAADRTL